MLHKNGAWVDAEMISDVLWEHRAVSDIKKQLHTTVYYCRQALGQTGFGEMIESRHGAYRLDMSRIDWDYAHLSALLHQAANRPVSAGH